MSYELRVNQLRVMSYKLRVNNASSTIVWTPELLNSWTPFKNCKQKYCLNSWNSWTPELLKKLLHSFTPKIKNTSQCLFENQWKHRLLPYHRCRILLTVPVLQKRFLQGIWQADVHLQVAWCCMVWVCCDSVSLQSAEDCRMVPTDLSIRVVR